MKAVLVLLSISLMATSASAESWDCSLLRGSQIEPWDVSGPNLIGGQYSDLAPAPRPVFTIVRNTNVALVAINDNGNPTGFSFGMVTINKSTGKIIYRILNVANKEQEIYEGNCHAAQR